MEESAKINGKKKLPSIPSNYVTLLQLQERWIKEQERKQKEKEGKDEPRQEQEEKEKQVEERVNDEVAGRESRKNGHFRRYNRENGKRVAEGKSKEAEIAVGFAVKERKDVEKEKKDEQLKVGKKKKWKSKKKDKKKQKAGAENMEEGVVGPAVNPPLPATVENINREEEVIGEEVHAPNQASVEARTECKPRIITRTEDRTMEIGRRFRAMSMKGEIMTGDHSRYGSQNTNFNRREGNRDLNRSHYGKFTRSRERNQRNEGMVWVKKGEVSNGNVGGI
ncbi:vicilin-like seed storage protein At2g18540 [Herrania umbratica]|uniref:Vicilin-like seed storage protein At2g18540 n=1 Tax=Herrania umbratica TaxID=108875 RepID=A0A6J1ACE9_9ROSI|nr:vicilin-like seed storage protein At2g18540 [Herrania umbratica]